MSRALALLAALLAAGVLAATGQPSAPGQLAALHAELTHGEPFDPGASRSPAEIAATDHGVTEVAVANRPVWNVPRYLARVGTDGSVRLVGTLGDLEGTYAGSIPAASANALGQLVAAVGYADLEPTYTVPVSCRTTIHSAAVIDGERHVIADYGGAGPSTPRAVEWLTLALVDEGSLRRLHRTEREELDELLALHHDRTGGLPNVLQTPRTLPAPDGDHGILEIRVERHPADGGPASLAALRYDGSAGLAGAHPADGRAGSWRGTFAPGRFELLARLLLDVGFDQLEHTYVHPDVAGDTVYTAVVRSHGITVVASRGHAGPVTLWAAQQLVDDLVERIEWERVDGDG